MDPTTVEYEALCLPTEERAKLTQKLLLSLDMLSEEELEQAWLIEADRRARELDRGRSSLSLPRKYGGRRGHFSVSYQFHQNRPS
jgi:Putative addiction module component